LGSKFVAFLVKKNDICSTRPWVTCWTRNMPNHLIQDLENLCDPTYFVVLWSCLPY
jgi:hypothetical protein